jgi:hypothetical protein
MLKNQTIKKITTEYISTKNTLNSATETINEKNNFLASLSLIKKSPIRTLATLEGETVAYLNSGILGINTLASESNTNISPSIYLKNDSDSTLNFFEKFTTGENIEESLAATSAGKEDPNNDDQISASTKKTFFLLERNNTETLPNVKHDNDNQDKALLNTQENLTLKKESFSPPKITTKDDSATVLEDNILDNIDVLGNDEHPNDTSISTFDTTSIKGAIITLAANNTFTYQPATNFNGEDSFTYTLINSNGVGHTATVYITVIPVSDGTPIALDDSLSTLEDTPIIAIRATDNDTLADEATIIRFDTTSLQGGSITQTSDGTFSYTPKANYNGLDSFTYTIKDSDGQTDTATINITVTPVNDGPPIAADDHFSTLEDIPLLSITATNNDSLLDDATIISFDSSSLQGGTVTQAGDGSFSYTPKSNYYGTDSFTYTIKDTDGQTDTATVHITVIPVNDGPPIATDDYFSTLEDTPLIAINATNNDTLLDNANIIRFDTNSAQGGTITQASDGTFSYTPKANYNGLDSFTYTIKDSDGQTDTATINISVTPVSDGTPVALDDNFSTLEDTPVLLINATSNDTLADEATIIHFDATSLQGGNVTQASDGTFSYTPKANYNGIDSFTYTIKDSDGQTDTATISITLTPVSDAIPIAVDDHFSTLEDTPILTINATSNDVLADEANISSFDTTSLHGGTITQSSDGTFSYIPKANYYGTDSFTYTITDSDGQTDTATITIDLTSVNDTPINHIEGEPSVPRNGLLTFNDGNGYAITLIDVDNNITSTELSVSQGVLNVVSTAASLTGNGTNTLIISGTQTEINDALNTLTYTPNVDFGGFDNLHISTTDNDGETDIDTLTLKVQVDANSTAFNENIANIPYSTGLVLYEYHNNSVYPADAAELEKAETLEKDIDNSGGNTDNISRIAHGAGALAQSTVINSSNAIDFNPTNSDVVAITGLIYLEAGNKYHFAGSRDDALHIELGGKTMVTTTGNSSGYFSTYVSDNKVGITENSFSPTVSGYYTLEIYAANLIGIGEVAINLSVNNTDYILSADNFSLFANAQEIIAAGGLIESFTPNTSTGATPEGGYFAHNDSVDIIGIEGQTIALTNFSANIDPDDTLISLLVEIPVGASLYDGRGNIFLSTTTNSSIDLVDQSWSLTSLSLLAPNAIAGDIVDINVTAITQSISLDTTTTNRLFSISILPTNFTGSIDTDISNNPENLGNDLLITGSGFNDIITAEDDGDVVIIGHDGNDTITANNGKNTLFGGDGNDRIIAGQGEDYIFGGSGNDTLTGGSDNGSDSDADRFIWLAKDGDGSTDVITDFTLGENGDIIDIANLLQGETTETIANFLQLTGSTLAVDINGDGSGYNDLFIHLNGVTPISLNDLLIHNIAYDLGRSILRGTTGFNVIKGRAFDGITTNEDFYGNGGSDSITGNGGADRYIIEADDFSEFIPTATKPIADIIRIQDLFTFGTYDGVSEADVLDFSRILIGESISNIDNYLSITTDPSGIIFDVDINGDGSGTDFRVHVKVENLSDPGLDYNDSAALLDRLQLLINYGNIVID